MVTSDNVNAVGTAGIPAGSLSASASPKLARKLRLHDYFAMAFGTMVGTGWLVLIDDWLGRGGPLGAILAFVLGAIVLLPVGYVYGQWVLRLPDAAGEAAYTAQFFPPVVSYFTGWIMLLAYFTVCPWEAIALGKIAAYIFPQLDSIELYRVSGQPVFFWRLVLGVALTVFLTFLNYRGIRLSANFQKGMTSIVLVIFSGLVAISIARGTPANLHPVFRETPLVSILFTLQIVPFFLTGFESIPKYAEEANPELRGRTYMTAIAMALGIGASFYALSLFAVAYIAPWQSLLGKRFATAIAFEHGLGAHWPVELIFTAAMFGLFQCFNGNFAASTRMVFAFGRNGSIPETFSRIHPRFQTPSNSVWIVGAGTLVALFLGDALLIPVTEVGSGASAFGWLASCVSMVLVLRNYVLPSTRLRIAAIFGAFTALALLALKFLPFAPGHFTVAEYIALAIWLLLGLALWRRKKTVSA
ncbi:MAG: APC family permease [Acidobacteria bacterium]|nr:APC family permease [Acidobacteriota bacterium]